MHSPFEPLIHTLKILNASFNDHILTKKPHTHVINNKIVPQKASTNSHPLTFSAVLMLTFRNMNKSLSLTCAADLARTVVPLRPASVGTCSPRVFFNLVSLNCQGALWDMRQSLGVCWQSLGVC